MVRVGRNRRSALTQHQKFVTCAAVGSGEAKARSLRTNSRLLSGCHPAMTAFVQVDARELGQGMAEPQTDEHPVLDRRAQLAFALAQRAAKRDHPGQLWNLANSIAASK